MKKSYQQIQDLDSNSWGQHKQKLTVTITKKKREFSSPFMLDWKVHYMELYCVSKTWKPTKRMVTTINNFCTV